MVCPHAERGIRGVGQVSLSDVKHVSSCLQVAKLAPVDGVSRAVCAAAATAGQAGKDDLVQKYSSPLPAQVD